MLASHLETLGEAIDAYDSSGAHQVCGFLRGESDTAATPDSDSIARKNVAEVGAHVAGWSGIGKENDLLIAQALGNFETVGVGMRNPNVLCVRAGVATERVRLAIDACGGIAEERLLKVGIRVGVVAQRPEVVFAVPAASAAYE